ncbi:uncharacterized protein [Battus philenor]|uniref:uncharacterized protein n=1 Tax=Battus philenor TaxID=42288 RepID=UPI0035D0DB84
MPYEKNNQYTAMPFCTESNPNEFYTYSDVVDLAVKCELFKERNFKCRTVGILKSVNGKFYIASVSITMNNHKNKTSVTEIRLSLSYQKTYPKSTLIPYTVQVFGLLQWKSKPVIYVNLLQALHTSMAIRLQETLSLITGKHQARRSIEEGNCMEQDMPKSS